MGVVSQIANPLDMCVSSPIHFIREYHFDQSKYSSHLVYFDSRCTTEVSSIGFKYWIQDFTRSFTYIFSC
jgi:hypothetical protein